MKRLLVVTLACAALGGCATSREVEGPMRHGEVMVNQELLPRYTHIKPASAILPVAQAADIRYGSEGNIEIDALVRTDGTVEAMFVGTNHVSEGLKQSALRAMKQWKFPVMLRDGQPIRYLADTHIRYRVQMTQIPNDYPGGSVSVSSEIE